MRVEAILFMFVGIFLAISDVVYWFASKDPTGTTALALACGLGLLIGSYLTVTARRIDLRPEDRVDAEMEDGAGEIGFFSPHSWWPLPVAAGCALLMLGFVFGYWICAIGLALLIPSAAGFILEYYWTEQH